MRIDEDFKSKYLHISEILLHLLGKDKLGVPASEPVRLVLESDGTQVEDGEYFRTLANNSVLLLLRQGERWFPTGVDVIKAGELSTFLQFPNVMQ